jgi:hypothetical protein
MSDDNLPPTTKQHSPNELLHELGSLKELLDEELDKPAPYTSVSDIGSVEEYLRLKQQAAEHGVNVETYLSRQAATESDEALAADDEAEEEESLLLDEIYTIEDDELLERENDGDALLLELAEDEGEPNHARSGSLSVEEYFAAVAAAKRPPQMANTVPTTPSVPDKVIDTSVTDHSPPLLEDVASAVDDFPLREDVVSVDHDFPLLDEVVSLDQEIPLLNEVAAASPAALDEQLSLEDLQGLVDLIVNRKLERLKPELERDVLEELRKLLPQPTTTH